MLKFICKYNIPFAEVALSVERSGQSMVGRCHNVSSVIWPPTAARNIRYIILDSVLVAVDCAYVNEVEGTGVENLCFFCVKSAWGLSLVHPT